MRVADIQSLILRIVKLYYLISIKDYTRAYFAIELVCDAHAG